MRADAARNIDAVLHTGARLLALDPATSMATIATTAGVDRRTVYRRFATREALIAGIFTAKLDAAEQVLDDARLLEAPVAVALHRYLEGIIPSTRHWPVEMKRLVSDDEAVEERRRTVRARLDAFVERGVAEGFFRADVPVRWIRALLDQTMLMAAHQFPELAAPQAADLVVATLLRGLGGPTA